MSQVPSHVRAVLICSAAVTPDLGECTPQQCEGAMRVPAEFGNPSTCFMRAQTYLAQTSFGQDLERPGQDHLRAKRSLLQHRVDDQWRAVERLLWVNNGLPVMPALVPLSLTYRTHCGHRTTSVRCHKRSFGLLANGSAATTRQGDNELGKSAGLGLHVDPAAMLLNNDVVRHRQAEAGTLTSWLSGEERIEHLLFYIGPDLRPILIATQRRTLIVFVRCHDLSPPMKLSRWAG